MSWERESSGSPIEGGRVLLRVGYVDAAAKWELMNRPRALHGSCDRPQPIRLSGYTQSCLYRALTGGSLNVKPNDVPSNVKRISKHVALRVQVVAC